MSEKSQSVHYVGVPLPKNSPPPPEKKLDLLESIETHEKNLLEKLALQDKVKEEIKMTKKVLEKLYRVKADYEKAIERISESIIEDEAAATLKEKE